MRFLIYVTGASLEPGIVTLPTQSSILLMAGDVSGDLNMARLARLLLERHPGWTLYAVGGPHLVIVEPGAPDGEPELVQGEVLADPDGERKRTGFDTEKVN